MLKVYDFTTCLPPAQKKLPKAATATRSSILGGGTRLNCSTLQETFLLHSQPKAKRIPCSYYSAVTIPVLIHNLWLRAARGEQVALQIVLSRQITPERSLSSIQHGRVWSCEAALFKSVGQEPFIPLIPRS